LDREDKTGSQGGWERILPVVPGDIDVEEVSSAPE